MRSWDTTYIAREFAEGYLEDIRPFQPFISIMGNTSLPVLRLAGGYYGLRRLRCSHEDKSGVKK